MISDIQAARLLGLTSLGLGAFQLVYGRDTADALGIDKSGVVESIGGREIATGLMAMGYPDAAWPIWARVAGDVADLAVLGVRLGSGNRRRHNVAWAAIGVLGVALLDITVAASLTKRERRALGTAKRTHIRRKLGTPVAPSTFPETPLRDQ